MKRIVFSLTLVSLVLLAACSGGADVGSKLCSLDDFTARCVLDGFEFDAHFYREDGAVVMRLISPDTLCGISAVYRHGVLTLTHGELSQAVSSSRLSLLFLPLTLGTADFVRGDGGYTYTEGGADISVTLTGAGDIASVLCSDSVGCAEMNIVYGNG